MTKRGKILRDTSAGPGLVWVDQQQHPFSMGGHWRSATAPAVGMTVDVEFASEGNLIAIAPVTESEIAEEQAEAMMNVARQKGGAVVSAAIARFGLPLLISTGLLIIDWFFLSAVPAPLTHRRLSLASAFCWRPRSRLHSCQHTVPHGLTL